MSKTEFDVAYVASLARLNLTPEEKQLFQKQLDDVLNHVARLAQLDLAQIEAATHTIPIFNVFREDEPRIFFSAEQALSNAPQKANNLFIVTKVVE